MTTSAKVTINHGEPLVTIMLLGIAITCSSGLGLTGLGQQCNYNYS